MFECKVCSKVLISAKQLSSHFRSSHKITARQYYDTYLKSSNAGRCNCGTPTKFKNIVDGYYLTCSRHCGNTSDARIQKIKDTKNEKYGAGWTAIYDKQRDTVANWTEERKQEYSKNLSEGVIKAHQVDPGIAERRTATYMTRYSADERSANPRNGHRKRSLDQIAAANQKRKATELEKYGVESHTQTEHYRTLVKELNAVRSEEEKKAIIERVIATKINKGIILPFDHPDRKSKKAYKDKARWMSEFWAKLKFTKEELMLRGLNGVPGAVQLDHIVSLETCYRQRVPVEIASHWVNLRLITWQDNIQKRTTDHMTTQELNEAFDKYDNMKHIL